jgi:hypothetical protein
MRRSRFVVAGLLVIVVGAVLLAIVRADRGSPASALRDRGSEAAARAGNNESEQEGNVTAERLDALAAAKAAGKFGRKSAITTTNPATGWVGSQLLNQTTDDWEPAVAADPKAPYVYMLTTRFGQPKTCSSHCPTPYIVLTTSSDGGTTWGQQVPLCVCVGAKSQYDPTIEVVPNTGAVYSVFLNGDSSVFSASFTKSTDHGATWTTPVHVFGNVAWTDKPEVTMDPTGQNIYVSWNGPQGGDLYVGVSHDFGATWTQQKLTDSKRYYYAYDATVLGDGTVVFAESSLVYSGSTSVSGEVWHHAIISRDGGNTWENVVVAKVPIGEACVADGCGPDFYTGQASVVEDGAGHLVFAFEGPAVDGGPQRVQVSTSADEGHTWSSPVALSVSGEDATGPRLASAGSGDTRIWYVQTSGGDNPDAWNVWYRTSSNGGRSWSTPVKIDDAPAGAAGYVNANGFAEIYGDYGEIAVTSAGKTIAVWGEGFSYNGPGGTWFNLQK